MRREKKILLIKFSLICPKTKFLQNLPLTKAPLKPNPSIIRARLKLPYKPISILKKQGEWSLKYLSEQSLLLLPIDTFLKEVPRLRVYVPRHFTILNILS